ncbi:hypothetical protein [Desulforamulus ruminis]|uniref:hypothetical protein n=1 Tax=Desulforamulus ruminis TaxID=1564 RepID=UPI002352BFC4|nr:hypothetical protein [Desulforamulus ruminis]
MSLEKFMEQYPENFTGEVFIVPDPTPEQQAKNKALMAELEALTTPLVAWIRENHGPHTEVHVSWDYVSVKHDGVGIPFSYSEK